MLIHSKQCVLHFPFDSIEVISKAIVLYSEQAISFILSVRVFKRPTVLRFPTVLEFPASHIASLVLLPLFVLVRFLVFVFPARWH